MGGYHILAPPTGFIRRGGGIRGWALIEGEGVSESGFNRRNTANKTSRKKREKNSLKIITSYRG